MKYRFEVIYTNEYVKRASELMKKLDLDMGEIGFQEVFTFTTKKDLSIQKIKEDLKKCFELSDLEILKIEGGKVE